MSDVSHLIEKLPAGTRATMDNTVLTIGDMRMDIRTLLHECGTLDQLKTHTFPANHPQYPRWGFPLAIRMGKYGGIVKHANNTYTAMHGKVPISTHPSAGDAALARSLHLFRNRKRPRYDDDDEFLLKPLNEEASTEDDVEFVKERSREERDAEGRANAVVVDM